MNHKSSLHIKVQHKHNRSVLEKCYYTDPFKVANVSEKQNGELKLMIMNSSPGMLNGDIYDMEIEVGCKCSVSLATQAYHRIYTSDKAVSQSVKIRMEKDSTLCYIPHPVVPHMHSKFNGYNTITLSQHATLVMGEIITCGRIFLKERFQFDYYRSRTDIFYNGKLIFCDNQQLFPDSDSMHRTGMYEGFTHQASLFIFSDKLALKEIQERLFSRLETYTQIEAGLSLTDQHGLVVRILGTKAEQLFSILQELYLAI